MKKITYTIIYACICSLSVMFSGFFWSRNKFDYKSRFFSQRWWEKDMKIYKILKVLNIHFLLIIFAIPTIYFLDGAEGYIFFFIYGIIGNLPFIIIQRYNRPRLIKLLEKMEKNNESINSNM